MKNRMNVPEEYEPVLPGKVEAHLANKLAQADETSLLAQTAFAVGKVIGQLQVTHQKIFRLQADRFTVNDLTPEEFRELKCACANHLSELMPDLAKEPID